MMQISRANLVALAVAGLGFGALYADVLVGLVRDWATDDNYSHGFLIVPFAAYIVWTRRARLAALAPAPTLAGLAMVAGGLVLYAVGLLGAERFLMRCSMIVAIAGVVAYVRGWPTLRMLAFPLAFLLLMVPIPEIVFAQVTLPLQLVASQVGAAGLVAADVPVLREGNVIVLAHATLLVEEACSGIRSLVSLLTVTLIHTHLTGATPAIRLLSAAATVPIAIVANGLRVTGTGLTAQYWGADVAAGFFHGFSGWLVFVVAFAMVVAATHLMTRVQVRVWMRPDTVLPA